MISYIKKLPQKDASDSVFLTRIYCLHAAYCGKENIARFWQQTNKENNVTALFSLCDGSLCIWAESTADTDEIKEFIAFCKPGNVFASLNMGKALDLKIKEECFVLKAEAPYKKSPALKNLNLTPRQSLDIFKSGLGIESDDGFVSDVTHRIFNNTALLYTLKDAAALVFYCKNAAFLQALAVKNEVRGTGLGSVVLRCALNSIENKSILVCAQEKNIEFYNKNGFTLLEKAAYFGE